MRAVLIASGHSEGSAPVDERIPAPLLPLLDRPFLQHVVEFLVRRGVSRFDFVLSESPEKIEQVMGDGLRWGVRFTYHLARDPARPYRPVRAVEHGAGDDTPFLLGHADRLPPLPDGLGMDAGPLPCVYYWHDPGRADRDRGRAWTGWALLLPRHLRGLPRDATEEDLRTHFGKVLDREGRWCEVGRPLRVQSGRDVMAAHRAVLGDEFSGLLLTGRERSAGGRLGRNVRLHPTARIVPPVYVGENSVVGAGVQLGPHAAVGSDCVLDANCRVANAVVLPDSYVGQSLDLSDVIIARNRLIDGRAGTAVAVRDPSVLADLGDPSLKAAMASLVHRAAALALLVLTSPVLLAAALWLKARRRGPVLHRRRALRLPARADVAEWPTFMLWSFAPHQRDADAPDGGPPCTPGGLILRVLPALINVVKGDLRLVGLPPRSPEEVRALPDDWRAVYLGGRAGVVTEASVRGTGRSTADELYATEALYAGLADGRRDLAALAGYFARCLLGYAPRRRG